jgi:hypothetical protein
MCTLHTDEQSVFVWALDAAAMRIGSQRSRRLASSTAKANAAKEQNADFLTVRALEAGEEKEKEAVSMPVPVLVLVPVLIDIPLTLDQEQRDSHIRIETYPTPTLVLVLVLARIRRMWW